VTLDRSHVSELEQPIGSLEDLIGYFRSGEKPAARWRVGIENEKLGLTARGTPIPYAGAEGIAGLLQQIAARDGWQLVYEGANPVALDKGSASITLEPGCQLELSGEAKRSVHEIKHELETHLEMLRRVCEPFGFVWLGLGAHPFHETADLPRVPKQRYRIMREYLPVRGPLALDMMHATASVQASFDFCDEADMVSKFRAALALTPLIAAIYANSSLVGGKSSGFISRRQHIWRLTDPDRCGLLPFVFESDFGYARYAKWALDVPMFFIVRGTQYIPMQGMRFSQFLEKGYAGHVATLADFERHLTTLFPEVRLKRLLEMRSADAVSSALCVSMAALWKGLLYDSEAQEAGATLLAELTPEERERALEEVARLGLRAKLARHSALTLAHELVEISAEGLRRQASLGEGEVSRRDESVLLDPVRELLALGKSPGEILLDRWEGEWNRSPEKLIAFARY